VLNQLASKAINPRTIKTQAAAEDSGLVPKSKNPRIPAIRDVS
jgi:hypothetical protein